MKKKGCSFVPQGNQPPLARKEDPKSGTTKRKEERKKTATSPSNSGAGRSG